MTPEQMRELADELDMYVGSPTRASYYPSPVLRAADFLRQCAEQRPDGWRLVPVEPTPEMLGAGSYAVDLHSHSPIGVYAAMLAAAPVPPQREPAHDIPLFDFDAEAWKQVLAAARDSKWMPAEYAMNDWLADICQWLRDGPPAGEQAEPKRELTADERDVLDSALRSSVRGLHNRAALCRCTSWWSYTPPAS